MSNKKSQMQDFIPLVLLIIIGFFVILFFSQCTKIKTTTAAKNAELEFISKDSEKLLINFLNTQISLETQDNSIAEAINLYFTTQDENLLEHINTRANEFFSKSELENDYSSWSLEIQYPGKKTIIIEPEKSRKNMIQRKLVSKTMIPTNSPESAEIRLFFVQTKFVAKR